MAQETIACESMSDNIELLAESQDIESQNIPYKVTVSRLRRDRICSRCGSRTMGLKFSLEFDMFGSDEVISSRGMGFTPPVESDDTNAVPGKTDGYGLSSCKLINVQFDGGDDGEGMAKEQEGGGGKDKTIFDSCPRFNINCVTQDQFVYSCPILDGFPQIPIKIDRKYPELAVPDFLWKRLLDINEVQARPTVEGKATHSKSQEIQSKQQGMLPTLPKEFQQFECCANNSQAGLFLDMSTGNVDHSYKTSSMAFKVEDIAFSQNSSLDQKIVSISENSTVSKTNVALPEVETQMEGVLIPCENVSADTYNFSVSQKGALYPWNVNSLRDIFHYPSAPGPVHSLLNVCIDITSADSSCSDNQREMAESSSESFENVMYKQPSTRRRIGTSSYRNAIKKWEQIPDRSKRPNVNKNVTSTSQQSLAATHKQRHSTGLLRQRRSSLNLQCENNKPGQSQNHLGLTKEQSCVGDNGTQKVTEYDDSHQQHQHIFIHDGQSNFAYVKLCQICRTAFKDGAENANVEDKNAKDLVLYWDEEQNETETSKAKCGKSSTSNTTQPPGVMNVSSPTTFNNPCSKDGKENAKLQVGAGAKRLIGAAQNNHDITEDSSDYVVETGKLLHLTKSSTKEKIFDDDFQHIANPAESTSGDSKAEHEQKVKNGTTCPVGFREAANELDEPLCERFKLACQFINGYLLGWNKSHLPTLREFVWQVRKRWFKVAGLTSSVPFRVRKYIAYFRKLSLKMLEWIINLCDDENNTVLHYTLAKNKLEIAELLLQTGFCNLEKFNKAGNCPMTICGRCNPKTEQEVLTMRNILRAGNINIQTPEGKTPLMMASSCRNILMVQLMIDSGAQINLRDSKGSTAVMLAVERRHFECAEMILTQAKCGYRIKDNLTKGGW